VVTHWLLLAEVRLYYYFYPNVEAAKLIDAAEPSETKAEVVERIANQLKGKVGRQREVPYFTSFTKGYLALMRNMDLERAKARIDARFGLLSERLGLGPPKIPQVQGSPPDTGLFSNAREFATIRSGKATTSLLDTVRVEAYGQQTPLNQIASVSAPEPRLLTVQPWDKSLVGAVEKAILTADLGLNPSNDGAIVRIPLPLLTEERRRELVKIVHKLAEEGRIAIRHARHEALQGIKKVEHVSDDEKHRSEVDVQAYHDDAIGQIEALIAAKEQEIMEV